MSDPIIDKLKSFVDPSQLILSLGFRIYSDNNDEIRAPCIIHGGDNKTAFTFKKESGRFYCYTHGCEEDRSGEVNNDVISLVMKVMGCPFMEAVEYLSSITGFDVKTAEIDESEVLKREKDRDKKRFVSNINNSKELPEISYDLVQEYYRNGAGYFSNMGLPQEIINEFKLGTMVDDKGVVRGSIPIYDDKNRLVSMSCRRVDGNDEPRYLLLKNFKKRRVLYNLNKVISLKDSYNNSVIVVEGFKACWHVCRAGFSNVTAVMGMVIRPEQVNLLIKYGFDRCFLMLDGDEKGRQGMDKSLFLLQNKIDTVPVYLPDGLSPDDLSLNDLNDLISIFYC